MTSEEALRICLVLLHVALPLLFTVTSFVDMPTNNLAAGTKPLPQGISLIAINVICGICVSKNLQLFLHQDNLFPLTQLFIRGNSWYRFQKPGIGKYAMPTGHLNFHFAPFAVSYELFPQWNQGHLDFFSIKRKSTLQFISEGFRMSYFWKKRPLCGLIKSSWPVLPYIVHMTLL